MSLVKDTTDAGQIFSPFSAGVCVRGQESERNQDMLYVEPELGIYILCDGHGPDGDRMAAIAAQTLADALHKEKCSNPEQALMVAVQLADGVVEHNPRSAKSGTTVAVVLVQEGVVHVAHLGDSLVCLNGEVLTTPHNADNARERHRIELTGGKIASGRLVSSTGRSTLAVTRSLGDKDFQHSDAIPSIVSRPVKPGDVLVMASDGVWDAHCDFDVVDVFFKISKQRDRDIQGDYTSDSLRYAAVTILDACRAIPFATGSSGLRKVPPKDDLSLIVVLPAGTEKGRPVLPKNPYMHE